MRISKERLDVLEARSILLTTAHEDNRRLSCEVSNLKLANEEARKTIDRLNALIPREANDGGPVLEGPTE